MGWEVLATENINHVNVQVLTNLVIAAELSEQLLVLLMEKQHIQAVNLVVVILAQAVILKQTPEVVMIQVAPNAERRAINQNRVVIQVLQTGVRCTVHVMEIVVKTERCNLVIHSAAVWDVLLLEEVLQVEDHLAEKQVVEAPYVFLNLSGVQFTYHIVVAAQDIKPILKNIYAKNQNVLMKTVTWFMTIFPHVIAMEQQNMQQQVNVKPQNVLPLHHIRKTLGEVAINLFLVINKL